MVGFWLIDYFLIDQYMSNTRVVNIAYCRFEDQGSGSSSKITEKLFFQLRSLLGREW